MKKRMIALLSVLCLTVGAFGACGKTEETNITPSPEATATVAPSSEERGDGPVTETPEPTATVAPSSEERGDGPVTETPEPTATTAPEATEAPEPTAAPAAGPTDLTYNFNDLTYNTSYGTTYTVLDDGSISLQYDKNFQEIKLNLPQALDMSYCTGVTVKMKSEIGDLCVKLYDENGTEVFQRYDGLTVGIVDHELSPVLNIKVAGIGLMACEENLADYSLFDATVYSVTFHMKEGWDSGAPAPTPTPIPVDPDDTGIWENNADISWIDPSKPMMAFTFDDGPIGTSETSTSVRIQNALAASGQHATFFYWGNSLNAGTEADIKRAFDMGFEIGNHTKSHQDLSKLTAEKILDEVVTQADRLTAITGLEHFLVRPPFLSVNATVKSTVREPLINCSIDTKDYANVTAEQIVNTINTQKKDGAIVLMHQPYSTTATAMETIIPQLVAEGWQIVSVSELFKVKGLELKDGQVYNSAK